MCIHALSNCIRPATNCLQEIEPMVNQPCKQVLLCSAPLIMPDAPGLCEAEMPLDIGSALPM